jgi:hypothetical protein
MAVTLVSWIYMSAVCIPIGCGIYRLLTFFLKPLRERRISLIQSLITGIIVSAKFWGGGASPL